jgi:Domain of unknown function (DUF4372)/Transposase DDE domain
MTRVTSIFSQLLQLFPRAEFDTLVRKHRAERHARGFTCWGQFVAMLFCQLGRAHSLREICNGLAASEGKLKHLGLRDAPRRATLSYANEHRPWQLFRSVFEQLYARCVVEAQGRTGQRFSLPGRLLSMDSTMISVCTTMFEWARYTRRKGAVKLHLLLDHDGYLPQFAVITDGLRSDLSVGMTMPFEPGATVVFDRGYYRFGWWLSLTRRNVFFVGRLKENARFTVLRQNPVAPGTAIRKDEVIVAPGQKRAGEEAHFRRIELYDEAKQETVVFVTNHHQLDPVMVTEIYRERWQIELFFKSLKQLLKIKTFIGTSENAVHIQIWTALIAMLVVRYLRLRSTFGWSLSNLVALLRQQLFVHRPLWTWLNDPFQPPLSPPAQLPLWEAQA